MLHQIDYSSSLNILPSHYTLHTIAPLLVDFQNQDTYELWYEEYNEKVVYLKKSYSLSDAAWKNAFQKVTTLLVHQQWSTMAKDSDLCMEYFMNRLASISATAAGAHFACAFLDISVIGGIMCHGAAFVYQISESNTARMDLKECRASSYR